MKHFDTEHWHNLWKKREETRNILQRLLEVAVASPTNWLRVGVECKYVEVRIDLRTGDALFFTGQDSSGVRRKLTDEEIQKLTNPPRKED